MCGIVGYVGKSQAAPILLDGLSKLEYRGYDSAGMAVYDGEKIEFEKAKGRLRLLSEKTHDGAEMKGTIGIGHTRWATHGEPSETNAHPHLNEDETIAVVHNGIIENYAKLKDKLIKRGYSFKSETDTEVVAHLLDYYYKAGNNPLTCVTKVMHRVEGAYALGIIFADCPDEIYSVRKDSPLIVGHGTDGNLIASDVPAVLKYTREVYFIENEEIAKLTENTIEFFDVDGQPIEKQSKVIDWDVDAAEKGGYDHFMIKEIHEEPKTVRDTLNPRIKNDKVDIEELGMSDDEIKAISRIRIVACGSAYHAGVTAKYVFEEMARIPVEVDIASEFRYRNPILQENELVIAISQSGETADTKEAVRMARAMGNMTLAIVNVVGSSIARESEKVMYTWAGPEISVATTKASFEDGEDAPRRTTMRENAGKASSDPFGSIGPALTGQRRREEHHEDVHAMKASRRAQFIAYVAQSHQPPFPYVTRDVVEMGLVNKVGPGGRLSNADQKLVDTTMQELGIWDLRNDVYTQLSGGELQLALIARAIVQEPRFVLMDEPTAALDYGNEIRVIEQVRALTERGIGVLMTTHNPDHAFLLDSDVVLLSKDEPMKYGRCWDVITDSAMRKTYETEVYRVQYQTRTGRRMYLCVPDV